MAKRYPVVKDMEEAIRAVQTYAARKHAQGFDQDDAVVGLMLACIGVFIALDGDLALLQATITDTIKRAAIAKAGAAQAEKAGPQ